MYLTDKPTSVCGCVCLFACVCVCIMVCMCVRPATSNTLGQFARVADACAGFLTESLQVESCVGVLRLADSHALLTLKSRALDYIVSEFSRVILQDEFHFMPAESLGSALSRDDLNVTCEECVFEALMRWVRAGQSERVPLLAAMLQHVRLPLLEPAYFVETVETDELIRHCVEAFPVIQEARSYHLLGREVRTSTCESLVIVYRVNDTHWKGAWFDPQCLQPVYQNS